MSSRKRECALTFKAAAAITKGLAVKGGADGEHVAKSVLATDKSIGLALNDAPTAEDKVEVALPGGGGVAKLGGTVAFGDLLAPDTAGKLVATTTPGDRYIAMAMDAGVADDLIGVEVVAGLI